jgi:Insertion element 4 transposase N-terminal/Transposase DDE domain
MARTAMTIGGGARIAEHLSVGVLARAVPLARIQEVLRQQNLQSRRVRDLPAEVVVYYVIALGLFMAVSTREVLRCLVEGLHWLKGQEAVRVAGKSAIFQARSRLGAKPLRELWHQIAKPLAEPGSPGAFFAGLRLVVLDGSTLDLPDTAANLKHYGRQKASRGQAAFPQLRFVGLAEAATHALFGVAMGPYRRGELTLAKRLLAHLQPGMLCLADRLYGVFPLWKRAQQTGAQLLWRARQNMVLPVESLLEDGSFLSTLYPSTKARRHRRRGLRVRVIEYQLDGVGAEAGQTIYRLLTTILDPKCATAEQLAKLYAQRWEIEGLFDELKNPSAWWPSGSAQ